MTASEYQEDPDPARAFAAYDRALHAGPGPKWLAEEPAAECMVEALKFGERQLKLYRLLAFCGMPNHVHLVIDARAELSKITKSIKGYTAREANKILRRTGEPFWQNESYDHWVRNEEELNKASRYAERNPVAAGLAQRIEA